MNRPAIRCTVRITIDQRTRSPSSSKCDNVSWGNNSNLVQHLDKQQQNLVSYSFNMYAYTSK